MEDREYFYEKIWFKNTILIALPTLISVAGVVTGVTQISIIRTTCIIIAITGFIFLIVAVVYYGNKESSQSTKLAISQAQNVSLLNILTQMEDTYTSAMFEISSFSKMAEQWADKVNTCANSISKHGYISSKAWDKKNILDDICSKCRDMIHNYNYIKDNTSISVGYIEYYIDENNEEWVNMIAHSNPITVRPSSYDSPMKLQECNYHYAHLIKNHFSDIEIAMNNTEVQKIFNNVSVTTDLSNIHNILRFQFIARVKNF